MIPYTYRPRKCKQCRESFTPERKGQLVHVGCIDAYVKTLIAKKQAKERADRKVKAKVERAQVRQRRSALKTIPDLIKEAQIAFNSYIRARDAGKPCICCGKPLGEGEVGGAYDCGHYRSVGTASHLRFNENNAHAQRKQCNRYGAGRAVEYRIGLIKRLGLEHVEALESSNDVHKWRRDELIAIRATYKAKLKQLKDAE